MKFYAMALLAAAPAMLAGSSYGLPDLLSKIAGTVHDPLGAVVPGATVELLQMRRTGPVVTVSMRTGPDGHYAFAVADKGDYRLRVSAPGFRPATTEVHYFTDKTTATVDLMVATPTLTEQVTVTATGTPEPLAQSGAPITVLTQAEDYPQAADLQEPLRLIPGVQMTQNGQTGAVASLFIRGGDSTYNKVLLDGVPVNDIGGTVNFGNLAAVGVTTIEVLRQPNSSLYGSDALAGVVSLTTTRGTTPLPLLSYAVDGGNFGLLRQAVELSGAQKWFDYYNGFAALQTANNQPLDQFHHATFAGNYGYAPDDRTDLRLSVRHLATNTGVPNAYALYGVADQANQTERDTYLNGTVQRQSTAKWHSLVRYGSQRLNENYTDFAPSGTFYAPFPAYPNGYIGKQVTLTGANGYTVAGQAILDYYGSFDQAFITNTKRDFVYAQTDYSLNRYVNLLGAYKYEAERGVTSYGGTPSPSLDLRNQSYTLQLAGEAGRRMFYTLGSGIEHNQVYGNALTPRVSLAYYAVRPGGRSMFAGTKLHGSFGKGVKEGNVSEQNNSVYDLLTPAQDAQFHIKPLGAEYSRTYDAGVEQQFGKGRVRVNASYFHNEFTNGIQYLGTGALIALGFSPAAAMATGYGAYTNSQAYRAQGAELETEFRLTRRLLARAGYTYLDAVVQRSFSSDALAPTFNTSGNFATIPIGVYAPLDGARPFRRAPHSGYFALNYSQTKFNAQLTGTLVGKRDDSTFLSDKDFGNSLLLPNRNLDGGYERLGLSSQYNLRSNVALYADVQNLLNQKYFEAFGYPALPFNVRGGVKFSFGGESFHLR